MLVAIAVMFKLGLTSSPFPKQNKAKYPLGQLCAWRVALTYMLKRSKHNTIASLIFTKLNFSKVEKALSIAGWGEETTYSFILQPVYHLDKLVAVP